MCCDCVIRYVSIWKFDKQNSLSNYLHTTAGTTNILPFSFLEFALILYILIIPIAEVLQYITDLLLFSCLWTSACQRRKFFCFLFCLAPGWGYSLSRRERVASGASFHLEVREVKDWVSAPLVGCRSGSQPMGWFFPHAGDTSFFLVNLSGNLHRCAQCQTVCFPGDSSPS